ILTNSTLGQFGSGAEPYIATTTGGKAHIIYRGGGFSNYNIEHAFNAAPGSNAWIHENIITPNSDDFFGVMTVGPDSIVNVAITGSGGFGFPSDVYYLYKQPGSQWSFPEQINSNFNGEAYSIFLDTVGFVHISINELSGNIFTGNVYYASDLQGGGGWLVTPLLTTGDTYFASLILDNQNYGWAIAARGSTLESQEIIIFATPDSLTGINNISVFDGILIYPNPVKDILNIKLKDNIKGLEIKILDLSGKVMKEVNADEIENEISININSLSAGIYFLQLKMKEQVQNYKIIVRDN
ncbi:MAG: T9SS type A sorting domain-containing protein, partial [Bacteroidia bacterium]